MAEETEEEVVEIKARDYVEVELIDCATGKRDSVIGKIPEAGYVRSYTMTLGKDAGKRYYEIRIHCPIVPEKCERLTHETG